MTYGTSIAYSHAAAGKYSASHACKHMDPLQQAEEHLYRLYVAMMAPDE
jgi:hypothetical protein